jgi:hypothetical protein
MTPEDLAKELNLSERTMRYILSKYRRIFGGFRVVQGELPGKVVEQIRKARTMVHLGQARSYDEAFHMLQGHHPSTNLAEISLMVQEIRMYAKRVPVIEEKLAQIDEKLTVALAYLKRASLAKKENMGSPRELGKDGATGEEQRRTRHPRERNPITAKLPKWLYRDEEDEDDW